MSWGAIGARNTESQIHRQLASGLSMPVGFKNATDGSVKAAVNGCFAAAQQHTFFGIDHLGRACAVETLGNPDCHVVLRGSIHGPNYDAESVAKAMEDVRAEMPAESAASHGLIVDCSHGNSGKDEHRQAEVVRNIASRIAAGEQGITGIMMESFIEGGNQKAAPLDQLVYGKSITDKCISWEETEALLRGCGSRSHTALALSCVIGSLAGAMQRNVSTPQPAIRRPPPLTRGAESVVKGTYVWV